MKKTIVYILLVLLTSVGFAQVKKNPNLKLYTKYECSALDDFLNTYDYLSCDKSSQYRFYSFTITDTKIVVSELNKMQQVLSKNDCEDLILEKRKDYDVYTRDNDTREGEFGFQQYYISKDKKKIINLFYGQYGAVYQTFYILNK